MSFDFTLDHFALFGLPRQFRLDPAELERRYRELQSRFHPDRVAALGDAEKRHHLQAATRINEAYQALKRPLARARYLLQLGGVDTGEETNTAMPADFLMAQMEWREQIAEARASRHVGALEKLGRELRAEIQALESLLAGLIDDKQDVVRAALAVRKLRFMERLDQEIGDAIEAALD
ncbi:Fe-S protein assembly co-chaperone HscB [Chitinimonas lacunae]|uniref:Co-chaperone protein HscB homolog n=1 Tax=Chitinimonas lacunae TaxID=1963018 RepID=A0ABV8MI53_9NEIS